MRVMSVVKDDGASRVIRPVGWGGFTLIELMVAVAIIALIAAIAYPSYLKQVRDSRRTTAITNLLNITSQIEKYYSSNNAYPVSLTALGYTATVYAVPSGSNTYYDISYGVNTTGYTLIASPQGDQANDTDCGAYSINYLGVKTVSGNLSSSPGKCWGG